MMKKKVIMAGLLIALTIVGAGCGKTNKDSNKLIMATNAEFPPYEYLDGSEFKGIDIEIANAIADKLGKKLVIDDMAFGSIIPAVKSGKADMGLAGMTVDEERLESVDFTDTYTTARQVVIVKSGSEIKTADDLVNKTIGVQIGTTGDSYAKDVEGATVERYNKGFEAVLALSQGKIDAVVIDNEPAKVFVEKTEGIEILPEDFALEEYAIAIKKGNTKLQKEINEALKELKDSGKLQEITDKYITNN